jgi:hypothetical protein
MKYLVSTLIVTFVLSACGALQSGNSEEAVSISTMGAQQIAIDVVSVLAK